MIWLGFAPCGECRGPVPRDRGCEHWRPQTQGSVSARNSHPRETPPLTGAERSRRYQQRKRAGLVGTVKKGAPPISEQERARRRDEATKEREEQALTELRRILVIREVG